MMGAMAASQPQVVTWSDHALAKADVLGIARRRRNTRAADWLLLAGRLAIAYNHPDGDDELTAHVVTLWRRR
jgi:hypothetical protein